MSSWAARFLLPLLLAGTAHGDNGATDATQYATAANATSPYDQTHTTGYVWGEPGSVECPAGTERVMDTDGCKNFCIQSGGPGTGAGCQGRSSCGAGQALEVEGQCNLHDFVEDNGGRSVSGNSGNPRGSVSTNFWPSGCIRDARRAVLYPDNPHDGTRWESVNGNRPTASEVKFNNDDSGDAKDYGVDNQYLKTDGRGGTTGGGIQVACKPISTVSTYGEYNSLACPAGSTQIMTAEGCRKFCDDEQHKETALWGSYGYAPTKCYSQGGGDVPNGAINDGGITGVSGNVGSRGPYAGSTMYMEEYKGDNNPPYGGSWPSGCMVTHSTTQGNLVVFNKPHFTQAISGSNYNDFVFPPGASAPTPTANPNAKVVCRTALQMQDPVYQPDVGTIEITLDLDFATTDMAQLENTTRLHLKALGVTTWEAVKIKFTQGSVIVAVTTKDADDLVLINATVPFDLQRAYENAAGITTTTTTTWTCGPGDYTCTTKVSYLPNDPYKCIPANKKCTRYPYCPGGDDSSEAAGCAPTTPAWKCTSKYAINGPCIENNPTTTAAPSTTPWVDHMAAFVNAGGKTRLSAAGNSTCPDGMERVAYPDLASCTQACDRNDTKYSCENFDQEKYNSLNTSLYPSGCFVFCDEKCQQKTGNKRLYYNTNEQDPPTNNTQVVCSEKKKPQKPPSPHGYTTDLVTDTVCVSIRNSAACVAGSSFGCPAGADIENEAECKAAAAAVKWWVGVGAAAYVRVGKPYKTTTSAANYPKGCFSIGNGVYTNTHATGLAAPSTSYGQICKGNMTLTPAKPTSSCGCKKGNECSPDECDESPLRNQQFRTYAAATGEKCGCAFNEPATVKPDKATAKPDTAKPDTAKPDTAKPDTAKPAAPAGKKYVQKTRQSAKVSVIMAAGVCEAQSPEEIKANTRAVAAQAGAELLVDYDNTEAKCSDRGFRNRERRATKDKFDVNLAFKDTVSADKVSTLVAAVNVEINKGAFSVEISVGGKAYTLAVQDVATAGTTTVTVLVAKLPGDKNSTVPVVNPNPKTVLVAKLPGDKNSTVPVVNPNPKVLDAGNATTTPPVVPGVPKSAASLTTSSVAVHVAVAMVALATLAHASAW